MKLRDFVEALRQTVEAGGIDGGIFVQTGSRSHEEFMESDDVDAPSLDSVATFEEEQYLTRNKGLVIRLTNGDEFQVSVVKSSDSQ